MGDLTGIRVEKGKHKPRVLVRVERWRPSPKFIAWVKAYQVARLADSLDVERITVYAWLRGDRPPHRDSAIGMARLSHHSPKGIGPLTLDDILGGTEAP